MKCASAFFQEGPLGPAIFRHYKENARGVQSLWLSYGVVSTCQCIAAYLRAETCAREKSRPVFPCRQFLNFLRLSWNDVPKHGYSFLPISWGHHQYDQESWFWIIHSMIHWPNAWSPCKMTHNSSRKCFVTQTNAADEYSAWSLCICHLVFSF